MNQAFVRALSRALIVCIAGVSFQAQAGLIGTDQAVSAAQARAARATVAGFVGRADVAAKLQSLGVTPEAAAQRVAALTDSEVAQLAGRIDQLPAGAFGGLVLGMLLVVIFLIWRFNFSDQAKAEKASTKK